MMTYRMFAFVALALFAVAPLYAQQTYPFIILASDPACSGTTSAVSALNAATGAHHTVLVPEGCNLLIDADATVPNGRTLIVENGATITTTGTAKLTFRGVPQIGYYQAFGGTMNVVGIRHARPIYWGANANTGVACGHDDQPGLAAAVLNLDDSVLSDGGRPTLEFGTGLGYCLYRTFTMNVTQRVPLRAYGGGAAMGTQSTPQTGGTRFWGRTVGFVGDNIVQIRGAPTATQDKATNFEIGAFTIAADSGDWPGRCLGIGAAGEAIVAPNIGNKIYDLTVVNCRIGIRITQASLIRFEGWGCWLTTTVTDAICILIENSESGTAESKIFTGGLEFGTGQAICVNPGQRGVVVRSDQGPHAGIAGIRFGQGHTIYHCSKMVHIIAGNGSGTGDATFTNGQWDGPGGDGFVLETDQTVGSVIQNVKFNDLYMQGFSGVAGKATAGRKGAIRSILVTNQWWNGMGNRYIDFRGVNGFKIIANHFGAADLPSGVEELIYIKDSSGWVYGMNDVNAPLVTFNGVKYVVTVDGSSNFWCSLGDEAQGVFSVAYARNITVPPASQTACQTIP